MATTQDYINQLKIDKQNLVSMLNTMGVEASNTETFTALTPKVGKIVTDPILQDKTIEITENGTITIKADEGYNGLNTISLTVNVAGGEAEPTIDYVKAGLIAWFDGEDAPTGNSNWYSKVGSDRIFETTSKTLMHDASNKCYRNNETLTMITNADYYKKGYTIEVVGGLNKAGWLFTMNETGSMAIGVTETGAIDFINNGDTLDNHFAGYIGKKFGASLFLENVVARGVNAICSGKASVNGCNWIDFTENKASAGTKYSNHPILGYYVASSSSKGQYLADGYVNCIRIYDRQLTNEEIAHNHAIDKARFGIVD